MQMHIVLELQQVVHYTNCICKSSSKPTSTLLSLLEFYSYTLHRNKHLPDTFIHLTMNNFLPIFNRKQVSVRRLCFKLLILVIKVTTASLPIRKHLSIASVQFPLAPAFCRQQLTISHSLNLRPRQLCTFTKQTEPCQSPLPPMSSKRLAHYKHWKGHDHSQNFSIIIKSLCRNLIFVLHPSSVKQQSLSTNK